jgi:hypothetical protein
MHKIGPPPSHSSWFFLMHMRLGHKSNKDTPSSLCSWGEHTATHDVEKILSPSLLRMSGSMFCMSKHMFSQCHLSNHHQMDIVLPANDTCTLANIVIVDPTCVDFV